MNINILNGVKWNKCDNTDQNLHSKFHQCLAFFGEKRL